MAVLFAMGGLTNCYLDPINTPPQVMIVVPVLIKRSQENTFTATVIDPGDRVSYDWTSGPGPCPLDDPLAVHDYNPSYRVRLLGDANGVACVTVKATDPHGATGTDAKTLIIENHTPVARIVVQQPGRNALGEYPLYSTLRLSAATSADPDGDPLSRTWALTSAPDASTATLYPCSPDPTADLARCLGPILLPGLYQVDLVVSDGIADSPPERVALIVSPDAPPCIAQTDPEDPGARLVWDPAVGKSFTVVRVDDDGDPYPPPPPEESPPRGAATFAWSVRRNDDSWQTIAGFEALNQVTIPGGSFISGDHVAVRVEVKDRLRAHDLTTCGDQDLCPVECPRRTTWTIDYQ